MRREAGGVAMRGARSRLSSSSIRDPPFMLAVAIIWPPGRHANFSGPEPKVSGPSWKSLRCLCLRQQARCEMPRPDLALAWQSRGTAT